MRGLARRTSRTTTRSLLALVVPIAALSGCGLSYDDLPSSGEPDHGYRIDAVFDDVLNLSTGAPVKLNGLSVGAVTSIELDGVQARVTLSIDEDTALRSGSSARLRYDTPLGEVYVEVSPGREGATLRDGDEMAQERTSTAPTVEDTLAQASLLVNGGGLGQLGTITTELNKVLGGREDELRTSLHTSDELLAALNDSQGDLTTTLESLRDTAVLLRKRRITLRHAVTRIAPAADVLRENQSDLTQLLRRSNRLADRATGLLTDHESELLEVLTDLGPVLQAVLASEDALVAGLTDVQTTADLLDAAIPGDFIGLDATLRVDLNALLSGAGGTSGGTPGGSPGGGTGGSPLGLPDLTELLGLLGRAGTTPQSTGQSPTRHEEGPTR